MRLCWTQTWSPSRIFYVGCPATTAELSCPKRGPRGLQNCKILSIWLSAEVVCQPLLISVMRLTPKGQTLRSLALHEKTTPTTTDTRVGTIHRLRTTRTVFPLMNHLRMEWPGSWTEQIPVSTALLSENSRWRSGKSPTARTWLPGKAGLGAHLQVVTLLSPQHAHPLEASRQQMARRLFQTKVLLSN